MVRVHSTDEAGVQRDAYTRPIIQTPDGPMAYTRSSTLAKALDNGYNLTKWKMRMVALGLAARPDLVLLAQTLTIDDKDRLDGITDKAMEHAGGTAAANTGTALHSMTEMVDQGRAVRTDAATQRDLDAYQQAMAAVKVVASEQFVVNDELRVAGTFDRLLLLPDGDLVIGDVKTGATAPEYPTGHQIQVACYAHGRVYDPRAGRRGPSLQELGASQHRGVLIHLPVGKGICTLYELDLDAGWRAARLATEVRALSTASISPLETGV